MKSQPAIFEEHETRRVYDEATETWLFSVIDIMRVLTQASDYQAARKYWKVLKGRLDKEGITKKARLELEAETGRKAVSGESYLPPSKHKRIEKK